MTRNIRDISLLSLDRAIGNRQGGVVTIVLVGRGGGPSGWTVSCEHPHELIDVIRFLLGDGSFIELDSGALIQKRHILEMRVTKCADRDTVRYHDTRGQKPLA